MAYFKNYIEQIDEYNKSISDLNNIDLTTDLTPPKELFIEIRVKEELGKIVLSESGIVDFKLNTTHLVRRSDVENLIK